MVQKKRKKRTAHGIRTTPGFLTRSLSCCSAVYHGKKGLSFSKTKQCPSVKGSWYICAESEGYRNSRQMNSMTQWAAVNATAAALASLSHAHAFTSRQISISMDFSWKFWLKTPFKRYFQWGNVPCLDFSKPLRKMNWHLTGLPLLKAKDFWYFCKPMLISREKKLL